MGGRTEASSSIFCTTEVMEAVLSAYSQSFRQPLDFSKISMTNMWEEIATPEQVHQLLWLARRRRWGLSLLLIGWLHLLAFSICYYMTIVSNYNEAPGYLAVWGAELVRHGLISVFAAAAGRRSRLFHWLASWRASGSAISYWHLTCAA